MSPPSRTSPPPTDPTTTTKGLTPTQLSFWHKNGYLLIPNALTPSTVSSLLTETHTLLTSFDLSTHPMTKFSTGQKSAHVGDDYFLTSHNKIRFFFEEDAFSPSGELTKPKEKAINKIGHYLHSLSPPFKAVTLNKENAAIARSLGFRDPRCLQSMVICKQPEIGGAVPAHQDSTFLFTETPSAVGFWYALEDATVGNGCLSFAAGSHKHAPVSSRFIRKAEGGTSFIENEGSRFPRGLETEEGKEEQEEEYTIGEVKAGTLVLIHGNLLHKSEKNTSEKSRNIYTFHVIEGEEVYDQRNWLQPPEEGFSRLYT
jgi:phytanoyl-CoA hydroxylase